MFSSSSASVASTSQSSPPRSKERQMMSFEGLAAKPTTTKHDEAQNHQIHTSRLPRISPSSCTSPPLFLAISPTTAFLLVSLHIAQLIYACHTSVFSNLIRLLSDLTATPWKRQDRDAQNSSPRRHVAKGGSEGADEPPFFLRPKKKSMVSAFGSC